MGVIIVSRGSNSFGKEISEKLAADLGYTAVSREVLLEASQDFNIPELQLRRSIHDAPSLLERFKYGRQRYIAYVRRALLDHLRKDNALYHGLAGHFFVRSVPRVLKVRITADMDLRIREEVRREGVTEAEARYRIRTDDEERRKWSRTLYGIDTWDSSLYDVVLHVGQLSPDDVVGFLAGMARKPCFQSSEKTQMRMEDLYRAACVECQLIEDFPRVRAVSDNGCVNVTVVGPLEQRESIEAEIRKRVAEVEGITELQLHIIPTMPLGLSF